MQHTAAERTSSQNRKNIDPLTAKYLQWLNPPPPLLVRTSSEEPPCLKNVRTRQTPLTADVFLWTTPY